MNHDLRDPKQRPERRMTKASCCRRIEDVRVLYQGFEFHKVKYDRPGECSPEKDCLR